MLFLKKLSAAQKDGDHIYAVIRSTSVNHGGRANSLTAPNPKAQAELLVKAYQTAGIPPGRVGYIEAHGTGTTLGDPIEVTGLKDAFQELYRATGSEGVAQPHCGLGSVKTNIGHAEVAAGVAGVIKVLLQLKHKTLVESLHCDTVNPYIKLEDSPFYIVQEQREWQSPKGADGLELPRVAGVSSFGFGGVNAHIVLEEYCLNKRDNITNPEQPVIIVLSAKSDQQLRVQAEQLFTAIEQNQCKDTNLADLAYTLQVGREAMEVRLGFVATSLPEVGAKLQLFLTDGVQGADLYYGQFQPGGNFQTLCSNSLHGSIGGGDYNQILEGWVKGAKFDWNNLYQSDRKPQRVSLPTYPFARQRYWVPSSEPDHLAPKPVWQGNHPISVRLPEVGNSIPGTKTTACGTPPVQTIDRAMLQRELQLSLAEVLLMQPEEVDLNAKFVDLGMDSVLGVEWLKNINQRYQTALPATIVYDYPNLAEFATYFESVLPQNGPGKNQVAVGKVFLADPPGEPGARQAAASYLTEDLQTETTRFESTSDHEGKPGPVRLKTLEQSFELSKPGTKTINPVGVKLAGLSEFNGRSSFSRVASQQEIGPVPSLGSEQAAPGRMEAIAIIGMAGQFPKAETLTDFWENLAQGVDCISEIPATRWKIDAYYDPDPKLPGKTYNKWLGVLEGADRFDPLFFGITPSEAELMDPQQRLFLENSWRCIEDAGLNPHSLSGSRCGVFVGCITGDYSQVFADQTLNAHGLIGGSTSILAARIAYLINLKGPCLAIDTACSSSLVAIAEACNGLILGTCDCALAGGVNVLAGPQTHIMASKAGMLSHQGRCFTFDQRADGFVPGEGVGVLFLKRLSDAVRDRDQIHGVIRGWGINQDGKTNGITAPSVNSQTALEKEVYQRFGINPETISAVEAHGTGTKLGDPIEVEALTAAFRSFTGKKSYCALGSVKSNIGHGLAAAGVAGVIKTLLAMRHRMLPPTIHCETPNEHLQLENSPFYLNTELRLWEASAGNLRRAAVSSFGFSGTNAHLVVEEYRRQEVSGFIGAREPRLFVLSARTEAQLKKYAELLKQFIETQPDVNPADLIYTLQVGRPALDWRLAFTTESRDDLLQKLAGYLGAAPGSPVLSGRIRTNQEGQAITEDDDLKTLVQVWLQKKKLNQLAEFWVQGLEIDWGQLYGGARPQRIHIPTYPFAGERYWLSPKTNTGFSGTSPTMGETLHPLLHRNTADLRRQRYSSRFGGHEFFLSDHLVNRQKVLPGVAYLEMARAAVALASGRTVAEPRIMLKDIVWVRPMVVGGKPLEVHIEIHPSHTGELTYAVYSETTAGKNEPLVHNQGTAVLGSSETVAEIDLVSLKADPDLVRVDPARLYSFAAQLGIEYGLGFKSLQEIYVKPGQVLARIELPEALRGNLDQYILHPAIMDGALQSLLGLELDDREMRPALPFSLRQMEIFDRCVAQMWAVARCSDSLRVGDGDASYDLDLCDIHGKVCIRLEGFRSRKIASHSFWADSGTGTVLFEPCWRERGTVAGATPDYQERQVAFCGFKPAAVVTPVLQTEGIVCHNWEPEDGLAEEFTGYATRLFGVVQALFRKKSQGRILLQVVVPSKSEPQLNGGLAGILQTARLENPYFVGQLITADPNETAAEIIAQLRENRGELAADQIRYESGKRLIAGLKEIETGLVTGQSPWRDGGVYLITGGAGGLGMLVAREIMARTREVVVIAVGRSGLSAERQNRLKQLEKPGSKVVYRQVDVTDQQAVADLMATIRSEYGQLKGIIHSAGIVRDSYMIHKTEADFRAVLAPKVAGLVNLDLASRDFDLEWMLLFASGAGVVGNPGQADYAAANGFMDGFAHYRNALVTEGKRQGRTLAIDWPLWEEGGMRLDGETVRQLEAKLGLKPLETAVGLNLLNCCWNLGKDQVLAVTGETRKIRAEFLGSNPGMPVQNSSGSPETDSVGTGNATEHSGEALVRFLKHQFAQVIKLPPAEIEANAPFEKYGIDSMMVMQLTDQLENTFGPLPKTLFFEYQNLQKLSEYFLKHYGAQAVRTLESTEIVHSKATGGADPVIEARIGDWKHIGLPRFADSRSKAPQPGTAPLDIAIIGLSGRYPGADNLGEFWENLRDGKDCITEIPPERWDHSRYFDVDRKKPGRTYSKWGGFLHGIDRFDPLFFNISPRDAELMDPQERLFLECAYEAVEDAGYTRETLADNGESELENNIGVYVGVMFEEYQLYGAEAQLQGRGVALGGNSASIANRVSYFFNFHGPSLTVSTMCSSSLTAIHLACQNLQKGDCQLALAGGVNLSVHPNKYLLLSHSNFASSTGRCQSFGANGDGYVPSEGVGAVLLKPLSKAIADGDHIYGVIKGSAINHGGKTNAYTVPNVNAQAGVIGKAIEEAGFAPRTISYIEAHGTGTVLGDPIEIAGLTKTFARTTDEKQFCAIGSVKSNIGHCESAAGVAGLTKVLLQLKHRALVPSIHSQTFNPHIDFATTPFVLQQRFSEWERPVCNGVEIPRRAGISSFGAGGANAHLVIEEYLPTSAPEFTQVGGPAIPALIVISAKNSERLTERVQQMLALIEKSTLTDPDLGAIAYTLQVGREAMEERLAFIADSLGELRAKLTDFLAGMAPGAELFSGQVKPNNESLLVLTGDEAMQTIVETWVRKGQYAKLLELWVKGIPIDWEKIYASGRKPLRISLPTYPFARERYWVPESVVTLDSPRKRNLEKTHHYEELIDEMMNNQLSIEAAACKIKQLTRVAGSGERK